MSKPRPDDGATDFAVRYADLVDYDRNQHRNTGSSRRWEPRRGVRVTTSQ
ncbi:hypothetical protein [Streptomyces sp. NPDC004528]